MMARPSKAPAAHDDSSDDEGEAEEDEDEGGDERQPSDDELAHTPCNVVQQQPKETEDIPYTFETMGISSSATGE